MTDKKTTFWGEDGFDNIALNPKGEFIAYGFVENREEKTWATWARYVSDEEVRDYLAWLDTNSLCLRQMLACQAEVTR